MSSINGQEADMAVGSMTLAHIEYSATSDDLRAVAFYRGGDDARWRVTLRRNVYDHQSGFTVDRWNGTGWSEAYTVIDRSTVGLMGLRPASAAKEQVWKVRAEEDAKRLAGIAASVTSR